MAQGWQTGPFEQGYVYIGTDAEAPFLAEFPANSLITGLDLYVIEAYDGGSEFSTVAYPHDAGGSTTLVEHVAIDAAGFADTSTFEPFYTGDGELGDYGKFFVTPSVAGSALVSITYKVCAPGEG